MVSPILPKVGVSPFSAIGGHPIAHSGRWALVAFESIPLFGQRDRVLFPGVPRTVSVAYPSEVRMVADAIAGGRFLAVLPVMGSTTASVKLGLPPGLACLARLRRVHAMPSGGLIVELLGIARARILREVSVGRPYNCVQVEVVHVPYLEALPPAGWLRQAFECIRRLRGFPALVSDPYPPGLWVDLLCHLLPLPHEVKARLLNETCIHRRFLILSEYGSIWDEGALMGHYLPNLVRAN